MQRRQVLIVDGHNVIRNNDRYAYLGIDYESGRVGTRPAKRSSTMPPSLPRNITNAARSSSMPLAILIRRNSLRKAGIDVVFSPCGGECR